MERLAVDVREAARLLSLSSRTVRRHIRSGRIRSVRVGTRVLVPIDVLIQLLNPINDLPLRERRNPLGRC